MSTVIDSITWLGSGATLMHESAGFDLSIDKWGFDVVTRKYEGSLPEFTKWRQKFTKNTRDPDFDYLYLTNISARKGQGGVMEATLTFKGTVDKSPRAIISCESHIATTELRFGNRTISVEYAAPITVIRYVSYVVPKTLSYRNEILSTDQDFTVLNATGGEGESVTIVTRADGVLNQSSFFARGIYVNHPMKFEPVGLAWQVMERNEGRLVDINSARFFRG